MIRIDRTMLRKLTRVVMIVALFGLLMSCSSAEDESGAQSNSTVETGKNTQPNDQSADQAKSLADVEQAAMKRGLKPAPGFSRPDLDGNTVNFADFSGKVVLVDFWATWCPPCRRSIPHLVDLHKKYADQGFEILGVSLDSNGPAEVAKFTDNFRIPYTIVMGDRDLAKAWNLPSSIPTAYLVDRDGNVVDRIVGYKDMTFYENLIKQYL